MGLLFAGCGLAAWFRVRTKAAALFALYGVFNGLFWGGVIHAGTWSVISNLFRELGSILSQAFLLHFALLYTRVKAILDWRPLIYILYAPTAIVAVLTMLVYILFLFYRNTALFLELGIWLNPSEFIYTIVYFLFAAFVIWAGWWRTEKESRRKTGVSFAASGLIVSLSPYLASAINTIVPVPWIYQYGYVPSRDALLAMPDSHRAMFFFSLIPVTFLIAILRNHRNAVQNTAQNTVQNA